MGDSSEMVALAEGVTKHYHVYHSFWRRARDALLGHASPSVPRIVALDSIDLSIGPGECVGVMGPNGAGKSTLLGLLTGALVPTSGSIVRRGRVILLDLGAMLNPQLSGRDNLRIGALALGMSPSETRQRLDEMVSFSELGTAIDDLLATYSTGMAMRLSFSLYVHCEPDLLIIDEAFAVGDARFVLKSTSRLRKLMRDGAAIMLASHDGSAIMELCDRGIVLDQGRIVQRGDPIATVEAYHTLLGVRPSGNGQGADGSTQDREDRSATEAPRGWAMPVTSREQPPRQVSELTAPTGEEAVADTSPSALSVGGRSCKTVDEYLRHRDTRLAQGDADRIARIVAYRVYRNGAAATGAFRHADHCTVDWLVDVRQALPLLTSGVHVHTQLGTYVFGTSYIHLGCPLREIEPGCYRLAITFEVLLAPGRYVISLGAAEPDEETHSRGGIQHDRLLAAFAFEVLPFELSEAEAVPFFGLVQLPANFMPPQRLQRGSR